MSKKLSELPVGAKVKAVGSQFYGKDLIFRVLGPGHSQDPADSVILQTNDIITVRCFDAMEPNNSNSNRQSEGNNRYLYSNLLQWMNSDAGANAWYTAKHTADQKPDSANVWQNSGVAVNPYDTQAGFMNGFTADFKNSLLTVAKRTAKPNIDGGGYEDVESKFFLLSKTEIGSSSNENNIAEGERYSLFSDSTKRIMVSTQECANNSVGYTITAGSAWRWWLRTPRFDDSHYVRYVYKDGSLDSECASKGNIGLAPACAISKDQLVSDTVDEDGAYRLIYDTAERYISKSQLAQIVTKINTKLSNRYTKDELDSAIESAISGVDQFDYQIVETLPVTGEKGVIYLVPNGDSGTNVYDEKIWIEVSGVGKYEDLGNQDLDDSEFITSADVKVSGLTKTADAEGNGFTLSAPAQTTLSSGTGINVVDTSTGGLTWEDKTWTGLSNFYGTRTWTDGENIYYSNISSNHYVLDKATSTWSTKNWNGLTGTLTSYFDVKNIWTDGENIYYSYGVESQYVLNKSTSTWEEKTWTGFTNIYGDGIWTDGENIYYSWGSSKHYVLDKSTSTWSPKTWNGFTDFYGNYIWTDGENIYCSWGSSKQYVLDKSTSTWSVKTWVGLTDINGTNTWTDGKDIYYSLDTNQYVLDKSTSTWSTKTWAGFTNIYGSNTWTDGENIYYSYESTQGVLVNYDAQTSYQVNTSSTTQASIAKANTAVQKNDIAGTTNQISTTVDVSGNGTTLALDSTITSGASAGATSLQPSDIDGLGTNDMNDLLALIDDDE